MVKEQMMEHEPVNTPDLLFLDHVTINGEPIAWIDAKHFYGSDVDFQRKKIPNSLEICGIMGKEPSIPHGFVKTYWFGALCY